MKITIKEPYFATAGGIGYTLEGRATPDQIISLIEDCLRTKSILAEVKIE